MADDAFEEWAIAIVVELALQVAVRSTDNQLKMTLILPMDKNCGVVVKMGR